MGDDENVTKLPVRFKEPAPPERTLLHPHELRAVNVNRCGHNEFEGAAFIVDEKLDQVTCSKCGERLNPMWVLKQLTNRDSRFHEAHRRYHEEQQRLAERARTKCQHCGEMTRISRR